MSRSERLLALLQLLRGHRYAITGAELASQLGISLRTLYRDIATLQAQGAHIEGEPGIGYVLRPGFMLPPLMFSEEELDVLVLGSRWVVAHGDEPQDCRYPKSRESLLKEWRATQQIPQPKFIADRN
ncbi:helix-turn-helix transcriptional regulator [Aeromonas veronii]